MTKAEMAGLTALPVGALNPRFVRQLQARALKDEPVSCYLYDSDVAAARAARLHQALPDWARTFYAMKANTFPPILRALGGVVSGFDVTSIHEAELAVAATPAGIVPRIIASGPGKSEANLAGLLRLGIELINVESLLELRRINRLAASLNQTARVALRVNPKATTLPGGTRIGGRATAFGIAAEDVPVILAEAAVLPAVDVVGFHFHELCNNLDADAHAAYVRWCLTWSVQMAAAQGLILQVVDVGGGMGVMFDTTDPFDLEKFSRQLRALHPPRGCEVLFEPGRWLVADSGCYAAEVTDLKKVHGSWFAVIRGGINHFLRPAMGIPHTFAVLPISRWDCDWPRPTLSDETLTVVGELCTPADVLTREIRVERIQAGDIIVFPRAGSYGWEMALANFLGHPPADRLSAKDEQEEDDPSAPEMSALSFATSGRSA